MNKESAGVVTYGQILNSSDILPDFVLGGSLPERALPEKNYSTELV